MMLNALRIFLVGNLSPLLLTIVFIYSKMYSVICVKIGNSKAFNALGLILLTFQTLVFLFKYIVYVDEITDFIMSNWAGVFGYLLLLVLFIRGLMNEDIILTVIGCLLWIVQFTNVFNEFQGEFGLALLYCSAGIMGVALIIFGLIIYSYKQKQNKH